MFLIDYRNNITLNVSDNGVIDFSLCGCDKLDNGDTVTFKCAEQTVIVDSFDNGVAKINIASKDRPLDGRYCIIVEMKDGRKETVVEGKFIRKGGC